MKTQPWRLAARVGLCCILIGIAYALSIRSSGPEPEPMQKEHLSSDVSEVSDHYVFRKKPDVPPPQEPRQRSLVLRFQRLMGSFPTSADFQALPTREAESVQPSPLKQTEAIFASMAELVTKHPEISHQASQIYGECASRVSLPDDTRALCYYDALKWAAVAGDSMDELLAEELPEGVLKLAREIGASKRQ